MTPTAVRNAIATALGPAATAAGLTHVSAYLADGITPPALVVGRVEPQGAIAMRSATHRFTVPVYAVAPRAHDASVAALLDELASSTGSSSIRAALEADRTLAGACSSLVVGACRAGELTVGATSLPSIEVTVEVFG